MKSLILFLLIFGLIFVLVREKIRKISKQLDFVIDSFKELKDYCSQIDILKTQYLIYEAKYGSEYETTKILKRIILEKRIFIDKFLAAKLDIDPDFHIRRNMRKSLFKIGIVTNSSVIIP